jgi:hypothetical protein
MSFLRSRKKTLTTSVMESLIRPSNLYEVYTLTYDLQVRRHLLLHAKGLKRLKHTAKRYYRAYNYIPISVTIKRKTSLILLQNDVV